MNLRKMIRQLPLRLAAGSFVINSGLSKWGADEESARHLEGFAAGAYPFLAKLDPQLFAKTSTCPDGVVGHDPSAA
jgi:hypothetical protein